MCEDQQRSGVSGVCEVWDVVVVGGGLSGLCAARRLKERNQKLRVLVLEAKDRVGGRTLTLSLPASNGRDSWDMGGQWVGSTQTHVMDLIQELGLEVYPQFTQGKKVHQTGGANAKISTYTSSIPSFSPLVLLDFILFLWRVERLCKSVCVKNPMETPDAVQLDSMTLQSYIEKHIWTTQLTEVLELCTRSVFGMEPSQMSFLYFLMYSAAGGGVMRLLETTPGSAQEFKVKVERLCKSVCVKNPMETPDAVQLDSMTLQSYIEKHIWTTQLTEVLELCTRSVFGMEPSQMSFLYFLMYSAAGGGVMRLLETTPGSAQEFKVKGGTQQLSERISEQLGKENVRLGSAVKAIWQNEESVEVRTAMSTITCKAVIVSCPPHMAALIEYWPALPLERQRLAQSMPVGHMTKFIITYPTAFWKQKGYSGEILARPSIQCPFGVTFDASSPSGSPALVGFIAGVQACYWNSRETEERRDAVVSSLVKYLGPEAASYIHYQEKDWAEEEYNGGCPVNVMGPGMLTFYHPGLRKPCGRIFWAGTETAMQWCGYLSGAVQSGHRAALEVLADVAPDVLSQSELQEVKADLIRAPLDLSRVWDCTHGSVTSSRLLAGLTVVVVAVGGAVLLLKPGLAKNCLSHVLAVV